MSYNRQINAIRNATSINDVEAFYQGARIYFESPDEADFAGHVRDQAFRRLGPGEPATKLEWPLPRYA